MHFDTFPALTGTPQALAALIADLPDTEVLLPGARTYNQLMKFTCLVLLAALLQAQVAPTIRVNVNLIQMDVTVIDKTGKHVPDLTTDDFEVYRDGKRQVLKSALWVPGQHLAVVSTKSDIQVLAPNTPKPIRPQEVRRTIALLIDDLSLSFVSSYYAKNALKTFVEENVQPGDLVALFRTSTGLGVLQQFTTDKRQLLAQIENTRFRSINSVDSLAPINSNPLEESSEPTIAQIAIEQRLREEINNRQRQDMVTAGMLSSVNFVVRGLRELPGRKSLILFSESVQLYDAPRGMTNSNMTSNMSMMPGAMGGSRERTLTAMRGLIDTANRSGVVLYTIDPRGLVYTGMTAVDVPSGNPRRAGAQMQERQMDFNQSQDGMAMLAEETGGVFYRNTNDIPAALKAALLDQEGYYLLAFQPDDETFEKSKAGLKYHQLSVKLKRSGLKVRYRHGLYGVTDEERNAKPLSPIVNAMISPFRAVEVAVRMTPIFLHDEQTGSILRTLMHIDPSAFQFKEIAADPSDKNQQPWKQAVVDQLVILFDQSGQQVDNVSKSHEIKLRGASFDKVLQVGLTQEIDMPVKRPGAYQLRAAIMDQSTKKTGSATQFIEVPDIKNKQLAMSDLIVSREDWMDQNDPAGGPAQRILRPGSKLAYGAFVYNAKSGKEANKPNLETQVVLFHDGKVVYTGKRTPFQPEGFTEGKSISVMGNMQLGARIAVGEYILQLAVRDLEAPKKQQYSVRSIDFEVRPLPTAESK